MFDKLKETEKEVSIKDLEFNKLDGLIPVIAQDADSGIVLMMAYANSNALQKTQETGFAHWGCVAVYGYWDAMCFQVGLAPKTGLRPERRGA